MADRVGQRLGNYRLIRLIGQGGFADVYLAEHVYLKTQAAIKVLQTRVVNKDLEDFLSEARTIAGLAHPHIVRIIDFGVEDGTPFLVMEYAAHGTLRDRHPKGTTLATAQIVFYVNQAAMALQYAHDKKLIHRDIKPENMLLGSNDEMLLSDFGIALAAQSSRFQSTKEIIGTAVYMAPEQFQGKPRPASDQYALGIVVYEWLCGDRPFHGSFTELYSQHMFVPPPPLREKIPTIHPDVEQVVLTALNKEPHQRFSSVRAFANALVQACDPTQLRSIVTNVLPAVLADSTLTNTLVRQPIKPASTDTPPGHLLPTISATPPGESPHSTTGDTFPGKLRKSRGISRRALILVLAGTAAIGLAGGGIVWLLSQTTHHEAPTHTSTPTVTPGSSPAATSTASSTATSTSSPTTTSTSSATATSSPTATSTSSPTATSTSSPTATSTPPTTTPIVYRGHSASVTSVSWSPDGKYIASTGLDATVQVWNALQGGNPLITYSQNSSGLPVWSVAWSPNGNYIAAGGADQTAEVWDFATRGKSPIVTYTAQHEQVTAVAWDPTNSQLIASGGGNATVQVWNALQGGNPLLTLTGHSQPITSVAWSPNGAYIAAGSVDKTVIVWNATSGALLFTYKGHSDEVKGVAWSPDSRRIASGSYDGTVQVWEALSGALLLTYTGHTDHVNPVDWSPNGSSIASGSWDKTVQVWDATSGAHLFTYTGHSDHVNAVKWSPGGNLIASGSLDTTAQVWQPS